MSALLSWALVTLTQASPTVEVRLDWDGKNCIAAIDGGEIPIASLVERGRQWSASKRDVHVSFAQRTPYRCIGLALYQLQMSGSRDVRVDYPQAAQAGDLPENR